MRLLETVKIKADTRQGFMVINKDDYDSRTMKLYKTPSQKKKAAEKAEK